MNYLDEDDEDGDAAVCGCDNGWRHGCVDDECRTGVASAEDCSTPIACPACNPNRVVK